MPDAFSRMEILLGDTGAEKLSRAKIAVFGLGGTGSYVAEALARCGVASLTLVDNERIAVSDINRQLYALRSTVGKSMWRLPSQGSKILTRESLFIPMRLFIMKRRQVCLN